MLSIDDMVQASSNSPLNSATYCVSAQIIANQTHITQLTLACSMSGTFCYFSGYLLEPGCISIKFSKRVDASQASRNWKPENLSMSLNLSSRIVTKLSSWNSITFSYDLNKFLKSKIKKSPAISGIV